MNTSFHSKRNSGSKAPETSLAIEETHQLEDRPLALPFARSTLFGILISDMKVLSFLTACLDFQLA